MRKMKKSFFLFFLFLQKLPDTICVRKGEQMCIFVHTICFGQNVLGPKQWKPGSTIKIVVATETAQNQKWLFFGMGEKVVFTNCVFEKLSSSENTMFVVFSAQHSNCAKKMHVEKHGKHMKNTELCLNIAKSIFVFVFWGLNGVVVCFLCVW